MADVKHKVETGAHSTDLQSPESVEHLCGKCAEYAKKTGKCGHRSCGRRIGTINNSSFTKVYI